MEKWKSECLKWNFVGNVVARGCLHPLRHFYFAPWVYIDTSKEKVIDQKTVLKLVPFWILFYGTNMNFFGVVRLEGKGKEGWREQGKGPQGQRRDQVKTEIVRFLNENSRFTRILVVVFNNSHTCPPITNTIDLVPNCNTQTTQACGTSTNAARSCPLKFIFFPPLQFQTGKTALKYSPPLNLYN